MNDDNFLTTMADGLTQHASARNVFGEPVRAGEKVIIPVVQVMVSMGGGYGHGRQQNRQLLLPDPAQPRQTTQPDTPGGGGGGGGMYATARGVFEITPKRTRFIPIFGLKELIVSVVAGFVLGQVAVSGLTRKQPCGR